MTEQSLVKPETEQQVKKQLQDQMHLVCWDCRGQAQRVRLLFEYCAIPYKQTKLNEQTFETWQKTQADQLRQNNPAIDIPYAYDKYQFIAESQAICVYSCLKYHKQQLLGQNLDEKINIENALAILRDVYPIYIKFAYQQYGASHDQEEEMENRQFYSLLMRKHLIKLKKLLGENQYICGKEITWIDFAISQFIQCLELLDKNRIFKDLEQLLKYRQRIWTLPQIQKYIKSERFKEKPCNRQKAQWR